MAVEAAREGFADVYEREISGVLSYLRAHTATSEEAEDLAAETFLRAWGAWPRFARRGVPERHWLIRIARNLVVDAARRRVLRTQDAHVEPSTPDSTSGLALAQVSLDAALGGLSVDGRELVGLRAAGLTFSEIGELTGRSEEAAKMAWHRCAKKLRAALEASDDERT